MWGLLSLHLLIQLGGFFVFGIVLASLNRLESVSLYLLLLRVLELQGMVLKVLYVSMFLMSIQNVWVFLNQLSRSLIPGNAATTSFLRILIRFFEETNGGGRMVSILL